MVVWTDEHVQSRDFTAQKLYSDRQKIGAGGDENLVIYFMWPKVVTSTVCLHLPDLPPLLPI